MTHVDKCITTTHQYINQCSRWRWNSTIQDTIYICGKTKSLDLDFVSNFNHLTHLVKSILTYIWQNTPFFTVLFAVVAGYFSPSITAGCISVFWQNIPVSPICTIYSTTVTQSQQSTDGGHSESTDILSLEWQIVLSWGAKPRFFQIWIKI